MVNQTLSPVFERLLGVVGLFLMLIVARLADRGYAPQQTAAARVSGFLARRGIDIVAAGGWLVDRLPLPGPCVAARARNPPAQCEATSARL
jgi:hypothetical protein